MKNCKRLGCNKSYKEEDEEICVYHSGWPMFSNLSKQWTCCKVEKHDWEEFMKVPGCTSGNHSDIKPIQPGKEPIQNNYAPVPIKSVPSVLPTVLPTVLPSVTSVTTVEPPLKPLITESGKMKCFNTGCNIEFDAEDNSDTACPHHPGKPVFRDTKKYWTCCEKSSYDWDDFMKIEKCAIGPHKPKMVPQ